jgi:hypothetical protein
VIVDYIDAHRHRFGVEPICHVLSAHGTKIAPSTYTPPSTHEYPMLFWRVPGRRTHCCSICTSSTGACMAGASFDTPHAAPDSRSDATRSPG